MNTRNIHALPKGMRFRADGDEWWPAWPPTLTAAQRAVCDEDEAKAREVACLTCGAQTHRPCTRVGADVVAVDPETRAQGVNCDLGSLRMHHAERLAFAHMDAKGRAVYLKFKDGAR